MHAIQWQPDNHSNNCSVCNEAFGFWTRRRHHCRACGELVCYSCSTQRLAMSQSYRDGIATGASIRGVPAGHARQIRNNAQQRVCTTCVNALGANHQFPAAVGQHGIDIKNTDLRVAPVNFVTNPAARLFAVGDLHGNALKLLHFLLMCRLVTLSDGASYARFLAAYDANNVAGFHAEVQTLVLGAAGPEIIFIGDTLCDRGASDCMTLSIMEWLRLNGINFVTLFSNHDAGAIENYMGLQCDITTTPMYPQGISYDIPAVAGVPNYRNMFENTFVPSLRVTYKVPLPRQPRYGSTQNMITDYLFTHAPCSDAILADLMREYQVQHLDQLSQMLQHSLANMVPAHNGEFLNLLHNGQNPRGLFDFIWCRTPNMDAPAGTINIFGHVGANFASGARTANLDTDLGKIPRAYAIKCNTDPVEFLVNDMKIFYIN